MLRSRSEIALILQHYIVKNDIYNFRKFLDDLHAENNDEDIARYIIDCVIRQIFCSFDVSGIDRTEFLQETLNRKLPNRNKAVSNDLSNIENCPVIIQLARAASNLNYNSKEMRLICKYINMCLDSGEDINAKDESGKTVIFYSLPLDMIIALIERGADINVYDNFHIPPFFYHLWNTGSHKPTNKILEYFLKHGADPNAYLSSHLFNEYIYNENDYPNIPLIAACVYLPYCSNWSGAFSFNLEHCVSMLLEHGADPNLEIRQTEKKANGSTEIPIVKGMTAMHIVNHPVLIKLLLQYGANINKRDENGYAPILMATTERGFNQDSAVQYLISRGADVKMRGYDGKSVLHSKFIKEDTLCELIKAGAEVNAADENGNTPLHTGVSSLYSLSIVGRLIETGADPNKQNNFGNTPLHLSSRYGDINLIGYLLEHGADPNIRNIFGNTPLLDYFRSYGKSKIEMESESPIEILKLFTAAGANLYTKNTLNMAIFDFIETEKYRKRILAAVKQFHAERETMDSDLAEFAR